MQSFREIENIKSNSKIFSLWESEIEKIVNDLNSSKLTQISYDPECRWMMGSYHIWNFEENIGKQYNCFTRRKFQCFSCQNINRIYDLDHLNKKNLIKLRNEEIKIRNVKSVNLHNSYQNGHLKVDKFSNNIYINWYLSKYGPKEYINTVKYSFVCGDIGTYLTFNNKIVSITEHNFESDEIKSVIKQLDYLFDQLKKFNFVYNEVLNTTMVFNTEEKKIKLDDFTSSSMNFVHSDKNSRIYSEYFFEDKNPFQSNIEIYSVNNIDYFKLNIIHIKKQKIFLTKRILGETISDLDNSVINKYLSLFMLVSIKNIYNTVINDLTLSTWFKKLFLSSQLKELEIYIKQIHDEKLTIDSYWLMSKFYLNKNFSLK